MKIRATTGTILTVLLLALNFGGICGYIEAPDSDSLDQDWYSLIKLYGGPHDIGIPNVTASKTVVRQGYSLQINVEVINYGLHSETFNVTTYANATLIATFTNITLTSRNFKTLTFNWNTTGFPYGNYTISATATPVPDETDTTDNTYIDCWVVVTVWGDADGDCHVTLADLSVLAGSWYRAYGQLGYDPRADFNGDEKVTLADFVILALNLCVRIHFDRSIYYPPEEVFWEHDLSVPIGIEVIDYDVNPNSLKVNVSSSIDSKEVTLTEDSPGVFSGVVFAVGIGMMGEPISNASIFNVRYGDEIIAEYFDTSSGMNFTASALFVFPQYVLEGEHCLDSKWKAWKYFDSDGVPLVNYGGSIGLQYNAVTISEYALRHYREYLNTGDPTFRETFLVQANWLVENAKQKGNFSVWEYNFDWPSYGCTDPWVSAMAQGEALSVLARAYVLTGNTSYIDVGDMAIGSFEVEMSAGGVRYTDSSGVWFEECADVGIASSKVLNGFIYSVLGLYEYWFETNSSRGWTLFWEGTDTLSNNMYRYDTGSWSYYDLLHYNTAQLMYHKIHIRQLSTMYKLTDDETFLYYSSKFQSYIT